MDLTITLEQLFHLGAALAIGLLIGTERGWHKRQAKEGERVAGIRTFGLIGLLGGVTGLLTDQLGAIAYGLTFLGVAGVLSIGYIFSLKRHDDLSITSLIASLLTFILGTLCTLGYVSVAGSAGVVMAIILGIKPVLHQWLLKLEQKELYAGLKLLLISVVLLSILPNKAYGPWEALNPFQIWWMVVLVASISFVAYFSMKIAGARKGVFLTAFVSGMISSTALTYHFSKLSKNHPKLAPVLCMGILLASSMMFLRMLLFVALLRIQLLSVLLVPALIMAGLLCLPVLYYFFKVRTLPQTEEPDLHNPLALSSAILFGAILAIVILLSKGLESYFGESGLYTISVIAGLVDMDAIVLAITQMDHLAFHVATVAILLATITNTLLKGILAWGIGGKRVLMYSTLPLVVVSAMGVGMSVYFIL